MLPAINQVSSRYHTLSSCKVCDLSIYPFLFLVFLSLFSFSGDLHNFPIHFMVLGIFLYSGCLRVILLATNDHSGIMVDRS